MEGVAGGAHSGLDRSQRADAISCCGSGRGVCRGDESGGCGGGTGKVDLDAVGKSDGQVAACADLQNRVNGFYRGCQSEVMLEVDRESAYPEFKVGFGDARGAFNRGAGHARDGRRLFTACRGGAGGSGAWRRH